MEALDGNKRHIGISTTINREKIDRINTDRSYSSSNTMAATAVVSPTPSMYSNGPPPPYTSGWPAPGPRSVSGLISPPDSRRTSDNKAEPPPQIQTGPPQHRQSLPSIHEALSSGSRPNPYKSPVSASFPPQQLPFTQQGQSIPQTYAPSDHAAYPQALAPSQRQPSPPQPVHPQPSPFSRPEPSGFSEPSRHPSLTTLQPAPGPHNPYAPRYDTSRYEQDHRLSERLPERVPNNYAHHPAPPQQGSYTYGPLPHQPPPTGHHGPTYNQPRYQPRDGHEMSDSWKGQTEKNESIFKQGLKRQLEVYDFEYNLSQINTSSSALNEWSGYYHAIAQEQQRTVNGVPDRMPDLQQCTNMLHEAHVIVSTLQRMQEMVREQEQTMMADQRMREQGGRPGAYDDEMSMYGEDMKHQGYSESKKRRGRAAPPGRCHSCNRAETPEWRRGPDGARTLCNACGLHYAKLTRKQGMKNSQGSNGSNLRPKSMDGSDTRPSVQ